MEIYDIQKVFPDGNFLSNPKLLEDIKSLNIKGQVSSIKYKNRLDLLSYDLYSTTDLWWILGIYNDIINPMNFDIPLLSYSDYDDIIELIKRHTPNEL